MAPRSSGRNSDVQFVRLVQNQFKGTVDIISSDTQSRSCLLDLLSNPLHLFLKDKLSIKSEVIKIRILELYHAPINKLSKVIKMYQMTSFLQ